MVTRTLLEGQGRTLVFVFLSGLTILGWSSTHFAHGEVALSPKLYISGTNWTNVIDNNVGPAGMITVINSYSHSINFSVWTGENYDVEFPGFVGLESPVGTMFYALPFQIMNDLGVNSSLALKFETGEDGTLFSYIDPPRLTNMFVDFSFEPLPEVYASTIHEPYTVPQIIEITPEYGIGMSYAVQMAHESGNVIFFDSNVTDRATGGAIMHLLPQVPGVYDVNVTGMNYKGEAVTVSRQIEVYAKIPSFDKRVTFMGYYGPTFPDKWLKEGVYTFDNGVFPSSPANCTQRSNGKLIEEYVGIIFVPDDKGLMYKFHQDTWDLGWNDVFINCTNPVSNLECDYRVFVVSAADVATVQLEANPLPFDRVYKNATALALIQVNESMRFDYKNLNISLECGPDGSPSGPKYIGGGIRECSCVYTTINEQVMTIILTSFGVTRTVVLNVSIGVLELEIAGGKPTVMIGEPVEFLMTFKGSGNATLFFTLDDGASFVFTTSVTNGSSSSYSYIDNFTEPALKTACLRADYLSAMDEKCMVFQVLTPCFDTNGVFDPSYTSELSALNAQLSEIPTISARVWVSGDCYGNFSLMFRWGVALRDGSEWKAVPIEQPHAINLVLSKFITQGGTYRIFLAVNTTNTDDHVNGTMYMKVELPPLVAQIHGGNFQQIPEGGYITLDAETLSYDPANITDKRGLHFSWACYRLQPGSNFLKFTFPWSVRTYRTDDPPCGLEIPDGGVPTLSLAGFPVKALLLFEVTVSKDIRTAITVQSAEIIDVEPVKLGLLCVWNCLPKLVLADRTVLKPLITCTDCSTEDIVTANYTWTMKEENPRDNTEQEIWNQYFSTTPTSSTLDIEGGWWIPGNIYVATVTVQIGNLPPGTAIYSLYANEPPYGGTCTVTPLEGRAGTTSFSFSFPGWKDEENRPMKDPVLDTDPPLIYKIKQKFHHVETPYLYIGGESSVTNKKLLSCEHDPELMCDIVLEVIDFYKSVVECHMQVKITRYSDDDPDGTQYVQTLGTQLKIVEESGDPIIIAQDACTYAGVANELTDNMPPGDTVPEINVTTFSTSDLDSLLNPYTVISEAQGNFISGMYDLVSTINNSVTTALKRGDVTSPSKLQVFSASLTVATFSSKTISGGTLRDASAVATTLSALLDVQAETSDVQYEVLMAKESLEQLLNHIVEHGAVDLTALNDDTSRLGNLDGLSPREEQYMSELLKNRALYKDGSILNVAPDVVTRTRATISQLQSLNRKMADANGNLQVTKSSIGMSVQMTRRNDILSSKPESSTTGITDNFELKDVHISDDWAALHKQVSRMKNIFVHGPNSKYITSRVTMASVVDESGTSLHMVSPTITHITSSEDQCAQESSKLTKVTNPTFIEGDASAMFYHTFEYTDPNGVACMKIRVTDPSVRYRIFIKSGSEPTDVDYEYTEVLTSDKVQACSEFCTPSGLFKQTGIAYIGLQPFVDPASSSTSSRRKRSTTALTAPYQLGISTVACYTWNDQQVDWVADRCQMTKVTNVVKCICDDGTEVISAISFRFAPNTIHFGTVFSKFDITAQGPVLGVLLSIYVVFALVFVWARYMDRKSVLKWGVFPLCDNYAEDNYYYLISVHTGLRRSAGTRSKVSFSISGDLAETGVRKLEDGVREDFSTGSTVHLVMACEESLGPLQFVRIWHDSSGKGNRASWFLDRLDITDLQTGCITHFLCSEWMKAEEDSLEKVIQATSTEQLQRLSHVFLSNTKKQITDDHIWLSVFIRPDRSRFSRTERVACCLTFLLLAMITSAMFYQGAPDIDRQQPSQPLEIGPFKFSLKQLYISLVSAAITSVPIVVLVLLYRKARWRTPEDKLCCSRKVSPQAVTETADDTPIISVETDTITSEHLGTNVEKSKHVKTPSSSYTNLSTKQTAFENLGFDDGRDSKPETEEVVTIGMSKAPRSVSPSEIDAAVRNADKSGNDQTKQPAKGNVWNKCWISLPWVRELEEQLAQLENILLVKPDAEEEFHSWPFWFRYIAWALVMCSVLTCSFFVVLYSMEWGKDITEQWLSTFFMSFLQSMVVVDPVKVIFLSLMLALFIRKANVTSLDQVDLERVTEINKAYGVQIKPKAARDYISFRPAMSEEKMREASQTRKLHMIVKKTLRELGIHVMILVLVCSQCYSTRNRNDYNIHGVLYNNLVLPKNTGFKQVNDSSGYFDWLQTVLVPWLLPSTDYRGQTLIGDDRMYTNDYDLYRLGSPRLRQLRMKSQSCETHRVRTIPCILQYEIRHQDTDSYCLGWNTTPCPDTEILLITREAWQYKTASEIWGIPIAGEMDVYGGGGYVIDLDINSVVASKILSELKSNLWIDRHTRGIFLEFTVYAPNTNQFAYAIFLAEFLDTGGVLPFVSVYPFQVSSLSGFLGTYLIICEILSVVFTVAATIYVVRQFFKHGCLMFKDLWFMLDVLGVITAIVTITMFLVRMKVKDNAVEHFNGNVTRFVNFQQMIVWDLIYVVCLSILMVIATLRVLRLAGYSRRTMRVYQCLRLAIRDMPAFFAYFWLIIISFASAGYILFGRTSRHYRSVFASMCIMFTGILGNTNFKETNIPETEKWITIFFFCAFVMFDVVFMANLFLAVLMELLTVGAQRDHQEVKGDNAQVFSVLWKSMLNTLGCSKKPVTLNDIKEELEQKDEESDEAKEMYTFVDQWLARLGSTVDSLDDRSHNIDIVKLWDELQAIESKKKKFGDKKSNVASSEDLDQ